MFACGSPTQGGVSWPHRELRRRPQWRSPHAVFPPRAAFRGSIGNFTEGLGGGVRTRLPHPRHRFVAPSGASPKALVGVFARVFPTQDLVSWSQRTCRAQTHPLSGSRFQTYRLLPCCVPRHTSARPSHGPWPHRKLHRRRDSQLRYSQLHMVGSFARLILEASCSVWGGILEGEGEQQGQRFPECLFGAS